jgi:hypothetical protein
MWRARAYCRLKPSSQLSPVKIDNAPRYAPGSAPRRAFAARLSQMTRSAKPKRSHFVTQKGAYGIRTRAAAVRGRCPPAVCRAFVRGGCVMGHSWTISRLPGHPPGAERGTRARHLVGERVPVAP